MYTISMQKILWEPIKVVVVLLLFMQDKFHSFHPVATILSYLTKAPLVSNIDIECFLSNT
jgi:hypothetical protein